MIAKEIAARRTGGSFRGLVSYLTSSQGKTERVGHVQLTNCVSEDLPSALLEVENTQAWNQRSRHTTYHVMLAFPAGEQPAAAIVEAIERRTSEALGFGEHQRVSVVHHDTDHLHVHLAINRIHPKAHTVHWPSYSKLVLDRLCVEFENEFGLERVQHQTRVQAVHLEATKNLCAAVQRDSAQGLREAQSWAELHDVAAAHGLQLQLRGNGLVFVSSAGGVIKASSVSRDLSKAALERRLGPLALEGAHGHAPPASTKSEPSQRARRPPDMERVAGVESLIGWVQRGCAGDLQQARSWAELHDAASAHGLRLQPRGNGLVFVSSAGVVIKASSVSRDLSKAALEQRLGAFEQAMGAAAAAAAATRSPYRKSPMVENSSPLYMRYRRELDEALDRRVGAVAQLRLQRGQDEERLRQISQRRWAAIRLVARGPVAWALWSACAKQADRRDRQRVRQRQRIAARAAAAQLPRTGWLQWLRDEAARGDAEALAMLRSRSLRNQLPRKAVWGVGSPQRLLKAPIDNVTATGNVIYRVSGGSIRDDGRRLHLFSSASSLPAAEALLRLAHARYGARIGVDGDERFRAQLVHAAVTAALPITFADEQLEQRRLELLRTELGNGQRRTGQVRAAAAAELGRTGMRSRAVSKFDRDYRHNAGSESAAGLRSLSMLPVMRFGRAPEVGLPADAHRREGQPDRAPEVFSPPKPARRGRSRRN